MCNGKTAVLRSSAGTQGVVAASQNSERVILGGYVTASAIAKYLLAPANQDQQVVTLVGMGLEATKQSVEDEGCCDYIHHLLDGSPYDHLDTIWASVNDPFIAESLRGDRPHMPREDVILALQRDLFDFVMVADGKTDANIVSVSKIDI